MVIPTYDPTRVPEVTAICREFSARGIFTTVVANSSGTAEALRSEGLAPMVLDRNLGFGGSVNAAADMQPFPRRAMVVMNDDITMGQGALDQFCASLRSMPAGEIWIFTETGHSAQRIPGAAGVLLRTSMLDGVTRRLFRRVGGKRERHRLRVGTYAGFALVGIGSAAWRSIGSFDPQLEFYFEDADYCRRAHRGGIVIREVAVPYNHKGSATGRRHIESVLPVGSASAVAYLRLLGWPRGPAAAVVFLGLCIRSMGALLQVHPPRRQHFRAIAISQACILRGKRPALPAFHPIK